MLQKEFENFNREYIYGYKSFAPKYFKNNKQKFQSFSF